LDWLIIDNWVNYDRILNHSEKDNILGSFSGFVISAKFGWLLGGRLYFAENRQFFSV